MISLLELQRGVAQEANAQDQADLLHHRGKTISVAVCLAKRVHPQESAFHRANALLRKAYDEQRLRAPAYTEPEFLPRDTQRAAARLAEAQAVADEFNNRPTVTPEIAEANLFWDYFYDLVTD